MQASSTRWKDLLLQHMHDVRKQGLLWRRITKCVIATMLTVIIILLPHVKTIYGTAGYLACMTTVFGHPGRRTGAMVEALSLAAIGAALGVGWASLGTYLSSLAYARNVQAAMAIRALFTLVAALVHGYVKIKIPRLFILVLLMLIPVLIGMTSPSLYITTMFPKQFFYPIFTAIGVLLIVNISIFPEFGGTYLGACNLRGLRYMNLLGHKFNIFEIGSTTVETLQKTREVQRCAIDLFVASIGNKDTSEFLHRLSELSKSKSALRQKIADCKTVYTECTFELAFSVLSPQELKPIAGKCMRGLVSKVISLVNANEAQYALLGFGTLAHSGQSASPGIDLSRLLVKRDDEIGDQNLLCQLLQLIEEPLIKLRDAVDTSICAVNTCVAYAFDVPTENGDSGSSLPETILADMDVHVARLEEALRKFDKVTSEALDGAAALQELLDPKSGVHIDLLPREEVFLISSCVLNLRQGSQHVLSMLKHSKILVQSRYMKKERRSLHLPKIKLRKWLYSSDRSESKPLSDKQAVFKEGPALGSDREDKNPRNRSQLARTIKVIRSPREPLADALGTAISSETTLYAIKFSLGVLLLAWPAFISDWLQWFSLARGVWAGLTFVLVFEVAIGPTLFIYSLRSIGTLLGSVWGYAAYSAYDGNEFVIAAMVMLGLIPSFYVQLGTQYPKAGMISSISMCVVTLSTHLQSISGSAAQNFYKRVSTMIIGGAVATLIQVVLFPVKARTKLRESLATTVVYLTRMESCIALSGSESKNLNVNPLIFKTFEQARKKANDSLSTAETFLSFTGQEPRLKGPFDNQAIVYKEMIFVLRQIVDRMEGVVQLREAYGSVVLEQYNAHVYAYRRNVAASITLLLSVVHEALATKLAVPQFLPSARLSLKRMVIKVRQCLAEEVHDGSYCTYDAGDINSCRTEKDRHRAFRLKLISWNASSSALDELVEYLEELIDYTKILVGANEFRYGLLQRTNLASFSRVVPLPESRKKAIGSRKSEASSHPSHPLSMLKAANLDDQIPEALTRIQSRRMGVNTARRSVWASQMDSV